MRLAGGSVLRRIRKLTALIASFGAVSLVLAAAPVQAAAPGSAPAASATTLPATNIAVTSAVLNATIETRGQPTQWEFGYGAVTDHDHFTPVQQIPAGHGTVHVSATITGLRARTTYYFRAIALSGIGTFYIEVYNAAELTFTTKAWHGRLFLVGKRLHVSGQAVRAKLTCASTRACVGHLSIRTRGQGSPGSLVCAAKSFKRIGAGRTRTVQARMSSACMALLMSAPGHRVSATFSSATTTGQRGQTKPVQLVLG